MPSSPSMNNQSAQAWPAIWWYAPENGPLVAKPRKPAVGLPPLTQASLPAVSWPSPNALSRKAHRNTQPRLSRIAAAITYATRGVVPPGAGVSSVRCAFRS